MKRKHAIWSKGKKKPFPPAQPSGGNVQVVDDQQVETHPRLAQVLEEIRQLDARNNPIVVGQEIKSNELKGEIKMAKNWTIAEAVKAYKENDKFAILDIGKRYPLFANLAARIAAGDADAVTEMLGTLPDYMTANKVNKRIKEDLGETDDADEEGTEEDTEADAEEETEKPAPNGKPAAKAKKSEETKTTKATKTTTTTKKVEEEEAEDDEETGDGDGDGYEDMTPVELFKLCKKRGIDCKSKRPSKEYIKLLRDADAGSDDDDWDAGSDDDEKPAKAPAKNEKPAAKGKKAKAEDDDDDDDWDI